MKIIKGFAKIILSGIVAVCIISVILCCYSITPVHIENKKGNTDYVWPANSLWVTMDEGIAWGKYDENGFNNISVIDNPDIIFLGSSHIEATNVMQDENAPYILNDKLHGRYVVYNMGISGHDFFKQCQYIPVNLKLYNNIPKVVILETSTVDILKKSVDEVIQSSVEYTPSHSTGLIGALQRVPFFRLVYHQIESGLLELFMQNENTSKNENNEDSIETSVEIDQNAYDALFNYLASIESKYCTQIIIVYHPTGTLDEDGSLFFKNDECLKAFSSAAFSNDISFIDMTSSFEDMYYKQHHVAHGFITGEVGKGHLNAYGHAAIADRLYETINELEEEGLLCR